MCACAIHGSSVTSRSSRRRWKYLNVKALRWTPTTSLPQPNWMPIPSSALFAHSVPSRSSTGAKRQPTATSSGWGNQRALPSASPGNGPRRRVSWIDWSPRWRPQEKTKKTPRRAQQAQAGRNWAAQCGSSDRNWSAWRRWRESSQRLTQHANERPRSWGLTRLRPAMLPPAVPSMRTPPNTKVTPSSEFVTLCR